MLWTVCFSVIWNLKFPQVRALYIDESHKKIQALSVNFDGISDIVLKGVHLEFTISFMFPILDIYHRKWKKYKITKRYQLTTWLRLTPGLAKCSKIDSNSFHQEKCHFWLQVSYIGFIGYIGFSLFSNFRIFLEIDRKILCSWSWCLAWLSWSID